VEVGDDGHRADLAGNAIAVGQLAGARSS
jgi:hypothetical protein